MDQEKWETYFRSLSADAYLMRFWIFYAVSLTVVSVLGYFIFDKFGFSHAGILAALTALLGIVNTAYKFQKNKQGLLQKLKRLHHS